MLLEGVWRVSLLPPCDRPRKKLDRLGSSILGDNELLAIAGGALAFVGFHHYPSGDRLPNAGDIVFVSSLIDSWVLMASIFLSHLVLANVRYCSVKESGRI